MNVQFANFLRTKEDTILDRGREVIETEANALHLLAQSIDDNFVAACKLLLSSAGRVVVTGMGKSGHIGRKVAATLAATGTPAVYVHPAEAAHGDLGMLVENDILMVISNSGETSELKAILQFARDIGIAIIGIASQPDSLVMKLADVKLCLPRSDEACSINIAPTTSTTMQLALGDALAMAVMDMRGITRDNIKALHPGGAIGLRLSCVREIMHTRDMPLVSAEAPMREAIVEMTSKGFGITGVTNEEGQLVGVITDGDLRRHFEDLTTAVAADVMTCAPMSLTSETLAEDALLLMNERKITAAFVIEERAHDSGLLPLGIVHIHDFLHIGIK